MTNEEIKRAIEAAGDDEDKITAIIKQVAEEDGAPEDLVAQAIGQMMAPPGVTV